MRRGLWRTASTTGALGYVSERAVRLVLTAIVGVFVARYLGPHRYGLLSYAVAVYALLSPVSLLGMQQILVREFSIREDWRSVLISALCVQAPVGALVSVLGFLLIVSTRGQNPDAVLLAWVLLPVPLLGLSVSVRSYLEAIGRVRRIVVAGLVAATISSCLKLTGLILEAPVWVFGAFGTIEAAFLLVGLLLGTPRVQSIRTVWSHFRHDLAWRLLRESWPLLLSAVAITVYMKADILMLSMIAGDRQTGLYSAAARLSEVWYFVPISAIAAVRPQLARLHANEQYTAYRVYIQRFMTATVGLSLLALVLVILLAHPIISLIYGVEYVDASILLRIHILSAPFAFLHVAASPWFVDRSMTRAVLARSSAGAAINVATNLVLIPHYGAIGASIATLLAYASSVLLNGLAVSTRPVFWMQIRALRLFWPHRNR